MTNIQKVRFQTSVQASMPEIEIDVSDWERRVADETEKAAKAAMERVHSIVDGVIERAIRSLTAELVERMVAESVTWHVEHNQLMEKRELKALWVSEAKKQIAPAVKEKIAKHL